MPGLPRKSTKNQFTKLLKKSGKSKTNTESGATAVTKNISTKENRILNFEQFKLNEMSEEKTLFNDFPYTEIFEFATVYRKEKGYSSVKDFIDDIDEDDKNEGESYLSEGTIIAIGEQDWTTDEVIINEIIVITKDTVSYGDWTSDSKVIIQLEQNKGYVAAQEPVDLLETDYENGGGTEVPNKEEIENFVELYKLDHVLLTM